MHLLRHKNTRRFPQFNMARLTLTVVKASLGVWERSLSEVDAFSDIESCDE